MKITILAVGKEKEFDGYSLVNDYILRIGHYFPVEIIYLSGSDQRSENEKLQREIDKLARESSYVVALDETGKKRTSIEFSQLLDKAAIQGTKNVVFVIGGAYGIPGEAKEKVNYVLSLSDMTFTHTMTRLILVEQIYRACTILRGEKYHHG